MNEQKNIVTELSGKSRLGVVVVHLLSVLVIGSGCSRANQKVTNTANGVQNTANGVTNTMNAVNGASDAVAKTFHFGAATSVGTGALPPPQNNSHWTPGPATACGIDDMSDGNNHILPGGGRGGVWYSYVDKAGSSITPPAGTEFVMSPVTDANMPSFAARFTGNMGNGEIIYAGIGFTLTQPKGAYDASQYTGVTFWAKAGPGSSKSVRFKVPDVTTDPDGKVCTGCYNDFGMDLTLTESWQQYAIRFSDLSQLPGWGAPHAPRITQSALYGMQWQVSTPGTSYDVAVSNLSFIGCP